MSGTTFWMRWLDFSKLRDLFWVVAEHNGQLRAKDLNALGIATSILVSEKGEYFKPTTVYHYRRALERLGLVDVQGGRYFVEAAHPAVRTLLAHPRHSGEMTVDEKSAFATLVVQNGDCYAVLLQAFAPPDRRPDGVDDFIQLARPVSMTVERRAGAEDTGVTLRLRSAGSRAEVVYSGESAAQAILWALIPWCARQLAFLDEVITLRGDHVLYARDIEQDMPRNVIAQHVLELVDFDEPWATVRVEELLLGAGNRWRLSSASVRAGLHWLLQRYPGFVAPIATSEQFVLGRLHRSQEQAALSSYLRLPSGALVSHLRISSKVREHAAAAG